MTEHAALASMQLFRMIRTGKLVYAGNKRLMIYGTLHCKSGKRMNKMNRIFFMNEEEAIAEGYRPCGHCMREAYKNWKDGVV
ncbi:MAG: Ada metal-binding domain-containing protein [Cytophagales bacterium]|nr:Ada metal-binding domain-containing protein [Cytophagales bacterium]